MGISYNPSIVRNGLVCYLDPANPASYTAGQNLLTYSEQFNNAVWTKGNSTVVADAAVAPNGTTTADRMVEDATNGEHSVYYQQTTSNITQTFSVYLKAAERSTATLSFSNFLNADARVTFNIALGTILSTSSSNADYNTISGRVDDAGNGWFRCSITATKGSVNTTSHVAVMAHNGSGTFFPSNTSTGLYVWGAQIENNTSMGQYVQTVATAATTRSTTWVNLITPGTLNGTMNGTIVHNSANTIAPANMQTTGDLTSYIDVNIDYQSVPHTIIGACRYTGLGNRRRIFTGGNASNWLMGMWSGNVDSFYANDWVYFPSGTRSDNSWHIYGSTGWFTSDIWEFWMDGVMLTRNNAGYSGPNILRIGGHVGYNEMSHAQVGAVLVYNRILSSTEMAQTMSALRGRYGV